MSTSLTRYDCGLLRVASALALSFLAIRCASFQSDRNGRMSVSPDVAPGVILIDVLEGGQPRPYWQYEVQPSGVTQKRPLMVT